MMKPNFLQYVHANQGIRGFKTKQIVSHYYVFHCYDNPTITKYLIILFINSFGLHFADGEKSGVGCNCQEDEMRTALDSRGTRGVKAQKHCSTPVISMAE